MKKCRGLKLFYKRDVNEPFLPFLFCKFRFKSAVFRYNKNGFVLYTINVREKGTLVCKKNIAKHEKNIFVNVVCWKRTV